MSRTPSLLFACLLALPAYAQDKPQGGDGEGSKVGIQSADVRALEGKSEEGGGIDGKWGKDGAGNQPSLQTARGQCRFDGAVSPKRLMPGQTGALRITMILEGDAVLASASALQLKPVAGSFQLASWNLQPPAVARIAPAYLGQQVYDNWALIEAQVVMPDEARIGERRNIVLEVEFDLHHGSSAQPLGHFRETVSIPCEVGVSNQPPATVRAGSNPQPSVQAANGNPKPTDPVDAGTAAEAKPEPDRSAPPAADLSGSVVPSPVIPSQTEPEVTNPGELEIDDATPSGWLLGAVGGAAVLGMLVMLLLRQRR